MSRRRATLEGPHRIAWGSGSPRPRCTACSVDTGCLGLADLDRPTRTIVRYERERPGELVHVDVKKQGRIPPGGGWLIRGRGLEPGPLRHRGLGYDYLHIAVDDRSRVAYVEPLTDERKETAAAFMIRAIDWFAERGVRIERVLTDNGSCYRSRAFGAVIEQAGIGHKRTRPIDHRPTARSNDSTSR